MEQETIAKIIDTFKTEGIDLVVTLPEEPTSALTETIRRDPYFTSVTVANESNGISLCAGASLGGRRYLSPLSPDCWWELGRWRRWVFCTASPC